METYQTGSGRRLFWTSPAERHEWSLVQRMIDHKKATLLVPICGGELLSPELEEPVAAYLIPGNSIVLEVDRKALQVSQADLILVPTALALGGLTRSDA